MNQQDVAQLTALFNAGRFSEALNAAEQLRQRHPRSPFLYNILGAVHSRLGNPKAAAGFFGVAVQLKPDYAEALTNLGASQAQVGQLEAAVASHQRALALDPGSATAHHNLGSAFAGLRHFDKASQCFRRAILARPDFFQAHLNLGNALREDGQLEQALTALDGALSIKPDHAEVHYAKGQVERAKGDFDAATVCLERALELKPDYTEALSSLIFTEGYLGSKTPAELRSRAEQFGTLAQRSSQKFAAELKADGELERIGFISADWGLHPVGHFTLAFLTALLPVLAAEGIRVALYSNRSEGHHDSLTQKFKELGCDWHDVKQLSDEALASRIREDGTQVLVDLSGHTGDHRLEAMAARCAPVQATWLGYFATTGLPAMDFIIGDQHVCPAEEEHHFVEQVQRLPHSYLCFTPPTLDLEVSELPAIERGHLTFGCLNNLSKMGAEVVSLWASVLNAVPGSRLLLKSPQLDERTIADGVRAQYSKLGVDPARLDLRGSSDRKEHLATYREIDIALDPFPYPGGTTSCEAYWMGVPVLGLKGHHFLSHVGESIAVTAGLAGWIADDREDYLAKAVDASSELSTLQKLRAGLRGQLLESPLCDAEQFARDFLMAAQDMWAARRTSQIEIRQ